MGEDNSFFLEKPTKTLINGSNGKIYSFGILLKFPYLLYALIFYILLDHFYTAHTECN